MKRKLLSALTIMLAAGVAVSALGQEQQGGAPTARLAAVQFALANGLEVPFGDLAVAVEPDFERVENIRTLTSAVALQGEASAIAKAMGRGAKVGSAHSLLTCRQRYCAPATKTSVLLVDEPSKAGDLVSIYIRVYSPSPSPEFDATFSHVVVEVQRKGGEWFGIRNQQGPSKRMLKFPKK